MKIYILRHEDRTIDATFFSPLTETGLYKANALIPIIEDLNITKIYCSPFIRTMQTIYPFAKKHNIKLNLEYSLMETKKKINIPKRSHNVELPLYLAKQYNYNPEYTSIITPYDIVYPEDEIFLEKRTKNFLKQLIYNNYKTNENILLVTHDDLCCIILKITDKFGITKPDVRLLENYPRGTLSQVFDNNQWNYKKIN